MSQRRTGEGGPQERLPAAAEPSGSSRPPRAPHLAQGARAGVVPDQQGERAIVTRAQRRRARAGQISRRQLLRVSFWGFFTFSLTGALGAFLSNFWPRNVTGFGGKISVDASIVPDAGTDPVSVPIGKFYLSHLNAGQGTHAGFGAEGDQGCWPSGGNAPISAAPSPGAPASPLRASPAGSAVPATAPPTPAAASASSAPPRARWTPWKSPSTPTALSRSTRGRIAKGGEDNPQRTVPYA